MSDFDVSDPPRYCFGLFGHRASGKSVSVVALGAARRPETDGASIVFVNALPPQDVKDPQDVLTVEQLENAYAEALATLEQGRLPGQTSPVHGNLRYAFDLIVPVEEAPAGQTSLRRRLEISDHAGELVNRLTKETERAALLRAFLAENDALILVAEAPRPNDDPAARQKALADVTELTSRLAEVLKDQPFDSWRCRSAVLLVTKWDRIENFDGFQYEGESATDFLRRLAAEEARHAERFDAWLQTAEAAEHRRLLDDLRLRFGGEAVRAYPVTAFGKARRAPNPTTGEMEELPEGLPLATLNLVRPLRFLAERTDAQMRTALLRRTAEDDPGRLLAFWRLREYVRRGRPRLPSARQLRPRYGDDPELAVALGAAKRRRTVSALGQSVTGLVGLCLLYGLGSFAHGAWTASQQRAMAEAALDTPGLAALIAADRRLAERPEATPMSPWGAGQRWVLDENAQRNLRARLEVAECAQWDTAITQALVQGDRDTLRRFEERTNEAPRCLEVADRAREWAVGERLAAIDQLLNDYEFVRAVEQIFDAARSGTLPLDPLRERLASLDARFGDWEAARHREIEAMLRTLRPILGALTSPPADLADAALGLREQLEVRRATLDLRAACAGFRDLRARAVELARAPGGWPRLDQVETLLGDISAWQPGRERSEFQSATTALRGHVEGLMRLRVRGVSTSGTLDGALRVSNAELRVTVGSHSWSGAIDTRRRGEEQLSATLDTGQPMPIELAGAPQIRVRLREEGIVRERDWSGTLGTAVPISWDALRDRDWTLEIPLLRDGTQERGSVIRVVVLRASPPMPPMAANMPAACELP